MYNEGIEAITAPDYIKENTKRWFEKIVSEYQTSNVRPNPLGSL